MLSFCSFGQGNALLFDGIDDHITFASGPAYSAGSDITVEAWINPSTTTGVLTIASWTDGVDQITYFYLNNGVLQIVTDDGVNGGSVTGSTSVIANEWTHVAFKRVSGSFTFYVNGVAEFEGAPTGEAGLASTFALGFVTGGFNYFQGLMDEVRVWDIARSDSEIQNNRYSILDPPSETDMVAYFNFDEIAGTTLPDQTTSSFDGTLVNFPVPTDPNWVESEAFIDVFTVTNNNDLGAGSLRQAITDANASLAPEARIEFNMTAPLTITLDSDLPAITKPTTIDGKTLATWDFANEVMVTVDLTNVGGGDGFNVQSNDVNIIGMRILNAVFGILINGETYDDILIQENIINQNTTDAIEINNGDNITIIGNHIGVSGDGLTEQSAAGAGITASASDNLVIGGDRSLGEGNRIAGAAFASYLITIASSDGAIIQGNVLGASADGSDITTSRGIRTDISDNITIGGANDNLRNYICGIDDVAAISISNADVVLIQNNYLGVGTSDTHLIGNNSGNSIPGVNIFSSTNFTIDGNLIGGSRGEGIEIEFSSDGSIINNLIGVRPDGITGFGNNTYGINFSTNTINNVIVGGNGSENTIAYNGDDGIRTSQTSFGTIEILQNNIFCNTNAGIDVSGTPVVDAPIITSVSTTEISGTTTSEDNSNIIIFESTDGCNDDQGTTPVALGVDVVSGGTWTVSGSFTIPGNYTTIVVDDESNVDGIFGASELSAPFAASFNNALDFDGINNYVEFVNDDPLFDPGAGFTLEAWIRPDKLDGSVQHIAGINNDYRILIDAQNQFQLGTSDGFTISNVTDPASALELGKYVHVSATFSSGTATLYINGSQVYQETGVSTPQNLSIPFYLGGLATGQFQGQMDEVRLWDVAKTELQIQTDAIIELTGSEPNLVAYFDFNQGVPDGNNTAVLTLPDQSGGLPGTLNNFTLSGSSSNWISSTAFSPVIEVYEGVDNSGNAIANDQIIPVNYGNVTDGTSESLTFAMENTSLFDLNIDNITVGGEFDVPTTVPFTIAPGATANFIVELDATTSGISNDFVSIESNDADDPTFTFPVTGTRGTLNPKVWWTDEVGSFDDEIDRSNLDGTDFQPTYYSGFSAEIKGIVVDTLNNMVFWTNTDEGTIRCGRIGESGFVATGRVLDRFEGTGGAVNYLGLDVDPIAGHVYWADATNNQIRRVDFDGSNVTDLTGIDDPRDVALDVAGGKFYYVAHPSGTPQLWRANLDGSGAEMLYSSGTTLFTSVALDLINNYVFWTESAGGVGRADLDGSNDVIITSQVSGPKSIDLDPENEMMYIVDENSIVRINYQDDPLEIIQTGVEVSDPQHIALDTRIFADQTPPTVVTQDITISLDVAGLASISPAQVDDGSTDDFTSPSNLTLSLDITDFDCSDLGVNTVTLTVTDEAGNSTNGTATVTVQDINAPSIITQDITVSLDVSGQASITEGDVDNGSSDNCSVSLGLDITDFDCTDLGANTVILTGTDPSGNSANASATITIIDNIDPTIITQDLMVSLNGDGMASITPTDIDNGSSDNCSLTLSLDITAFDASDIGDNVITLTGTDGSGNMASATATVTVLDDNQVPTISYVFYVDEGSPTGTLIGSVSATDPDGDPLTYSIVSGNTNNALSINSSTGDITVNDPDALDFEATPTFNLIVEVNDGNGAMIVIAITINLNDIDDQLLLSTENTGQDFLVYPNPASGTVYINRNKNARNDLAVELYALNGQRLPIDIQNRSNGLELDVSKLDAGIYHLKVIEGNKVFSQNIVVK